MRIDDKAGTDTGTRDKPGAWSLVFASWFLASAATLASLFLSEVLGMAPCPLCWYQRIFMYALVPVLLMGLLPLDRRVARYALPLAVLGWLAALYHLLVYEGVIPQAMQPCGADDSCADPDLVLGGIITVPALSMLTFTAIIALLLLFIKRTRS